MSEYISSEQKKYVDVDGALARVRGNTALYCKLLKMYLVSEEFEAFEKYIGEQNYSKACDVIHSIKGLSGNLSLAMLFELSAELNKQLKEGAPDANVLNEYRDAVVKTREAVTEFIHNSAK